MRIGELAERAGVTTRAIRHYEGIGVLPAASRSESGYRLYGEDALARQLLRDRGRDRPTQALAPQRHAGHAATDEVRRQAGAGGLDFGQLGHGRGVAAARA